MISIYNSETSNYANEHYSLLKLWVEKRIDKRKLTIQKKNQLKKDLPRILSGELSELCVLSKSYNSEYPKDKIIVKTKKGTKKNKLVPNKIISTIFDYSEFRTDFGFDLAEKLNISCCPYCNRNYTTSHETVRQNGITKKLVFPEFDHYLPKSEYPLLAISFYNLIPSCNVCNTHFKGGKDPIKENLFHPYTEFKNGGMNFEFYPNDFASLIGKSLKIILGFKFNESRTINTQIKNSITFFGIKDIYEKCHSDLIKDIIDKRITYSAKYLKEIEKTFKLDFESAYRVLFETNYKDDLLHKRPFSKLKKDIYEDMEIAKYY